MKVKCFERHPSARISEKARKEGNDLLANLRRLVTAEELENSPSKLCGFVWDFDYLGKTEEAMCRNMRYYFFSQRNNLSKLLASHPVYRALAILAFGEEGLHKMEEGKLPTRSNIAAKYDVHHITPLGLHRKQDNEQTLNHFSNLVVIMDSDNNPTLDWHGLCHGIIDVQKPSSRPLPPGEFHPFFFFRVALPFAPACIEPIHSIDEAKAMIRKVDPILLDLPCFQPKGDSHSAETKLLQDFLEKIVIFSRAHNHPFPEIDPSLQRFCKLEFQDRPNDDKDKKRFRETYKNPNRPSDIDLSDREAFQRLLHATMTGKRKILPATPRARAVWQNYLLRSQITQAQPPPLLIRKLAHSSPSSMRLAPPTGKRNSPLSLA